MVEGMFQQETSKSTQQTTGIVVFAVIIPHTSYTEQPLNNQLATKTNYLFSRGML